jgi:hypothetical protein
MSDLDGNHVWVTLIEGAQGVGKTTRAALIKQDIEARGKRVFVLEIEDFCQCDMCHAPPSDTETLEKWISFKINEVESDYFEFLILVVPNGADFDLEPLRSMVDEIITIRTHGFAKHIGAY